MSANRRSLSWLRLAAVYFALGVGLGVAMGASGDHSLYPVHAHINLLGWVSMTLFGLAGTLHPALTEGRLATAQFWIYNLAVPTMLGALALRMRGLAAAEPVIGLASIAVGVAVGMFAWLVFTRLGRSSGP